MKPIAGLPAGAWVLGWTLHPDRQTAIARLLARLLADIHSGQLHARRWHFSATTAAESTTSSGCYEYWTLLIGDRCRF